MTSIEFSYDPCCPFCWITSRWLERVRTQRDIDITWRPFSLAIKNNELADDGSDLTEHGAGHRAAHRVLRVIAAAEQQGADPGALYAAFGRRHHVRRHPLDDALVAEVLAAAGLPAELGTAADDTTYDARIEQAMTTTMETVGQDVGVPIIVFRDGDSAHGYFGPVLGAVPGIRESLALWDSLETLATTSSFFELKRTFSGRLDLDSTAGL